MTDFWCILRTSSVQTMALAEALTDGGIDAWTPVETVKPEQRKVEAWEKPRPRRNLPDFITRPLIPTFVFADAGQQDELLRMSHSPAQTYQLWDKALGRMVTRGRPFFTLFDPDQRPIPDRELVPLRTIAGRRRKPRGNQPAVKKGDAVRLTEGAYEGLRGIVISVSGKRAKVRFPGGHFDFDVYTWLLIPDLDAANDIQLRGDQAERRGRAA